MLVWLFVYSAMRPDKPLGSTAVLGPFMGGIQSTVFGVVFGAIAGSVAGLLGNPLIGLRRCVVFGVILMGINGSLMVFGDYYGNPERFAAWTTMIVGMDVASPVLAGIVAGALVAKLSKGQ